MPNLYPYLSLRENYSDIDIIMVNKDIKSQTQDIITIEQEIKQ